MKDIFSKITGWLGGSFLKDTADVIDRFVQTKEEKAEAMLLLKEITHRQQLEVAQLEFEAEKELNNRIKDLEGTAKDLNQAGIFGKFILFLRGAQRPLWGYGVAFLDYMVFSGRWAIETDELRSSFWVINLLVLGFLFGERAVKNVAPLILKNLNKKIE